MIIKLPTYFSMLIAVFFISACDQNKASNSNEEITLEGRALGTLFHIKYVPDNKYINVDFDYELNKIFESANQSMSTYHKHSELSKFNRLTSLEFVTVSPNLLYVITEGVRLNKLTGGSLDITMKPLSALWGFGPEGKAQIIPSEGALTEVRENIGIDKLIIEGNQMRKVHSTLEVDLNPIGKGYTVDLVAKLFERHSIENYLVEIGGEMRLKGHNGKGELWRVGVISPVDGAIKAKRAIYPRNNGLATSGDYNQYFEQDGKRYSHIIDPLNGRPISHNLASVTVIHPSSMTADGLATALMVLGDEKGLALAEKLNIPIYMIIRDGDKFISKMSSSFNLYLTETTDNK